MKNGWRVSMALIALVAACSSQQPAPAQSPMAQGADEDEFGCIGSAGYQWCARTNACERPWLLAEQEGFDNTKAGFDAYCD
ncbi:hypothetical protein K0504_17665 [Neiella marina]|uniref:Peptidase n=1 Tax=Neiella holothuriorum TaxID=2870530 RepID=A0ABS7EKX5_9GAMM|nr:hypothetical protein [Neiella holothuriorum]MBW8192869.1 hypothetical protein [Neiella holothuriorum]